MISNIVLFFLIELAACFNYSAPIIINTNIQENSFLYEYDQISHMILIGYQNKIMMYDLVGEIIGLFETESTIDSLASTKNYIITILGHNNSIYIYNKNGTLNEKINICGYHYQSKIKVDPLSQNYYVVFDLGWIYHTHYFSYDNKLLFENFLKITSDFPILYSNYKYNGYLVIFSTVDIFIISQNISVVKDIPLNEGMPIFGSAVIGKDKLGMFVGLNLEIYNVNGTLYNKKSFDYIVLSLGFNEKNNLLYHSRIINSNLTITFIDIEGNIKYDLGYGPIGADDGNVNIDIDEDTDIIIANINNQIMIWYPQ
jgi:hypothetical protein